MSFEEIYTAHNYAKNDILIPDITFIFDVSKKNIQKRITTR
jgi:thymidylate kinase